jgi:hypothetical protein
MDFRLECPDTGVTEWIVLAVKAPNLDRQKDVETTLPDAKPTSDLSPLKRPMLITRIKDQPKGFQTKLTIEATLFSARLRPRGPEEPAGKATLDADQAKIYTRSTEFIDYKTKTVQDWLDGHDLRPEKGEPDLAFARRAFRILKNILTYARGDTPEFHASVVCRTGKGDCGGLAILYVTALRAGGVPARILPGRMAESDPPPGKGIIDGMRHVRTEFFAKGLGWVPVDIAFATNERGKGELAWFGNDPGDFIAMHADSDLKIESLVGGPVTAPTLQGLAFFHRGPSNNKQTRVFEQWTVK